LLMPPHAEMLLQIAGRPSPRAPPAARRPDRRPKDCNAPTQYFISRANDFSPLAARRRPSAPCPHLITTRPLLAAIRPRRVRAARPTSRNAHRDRHPSIVWQGSPIAKGLSRRPISGHIRTVTSPTDIPSCQRQPSEIAHYLANDCHLTCGYMITKTWSRVMPGQSARFAIWAVTSGA
jgi:hypothetical protein